MWTPQYFVRYAKLPLSIEGVALPNDDGSFDIYINALLPRERQEDRLQHEIRHIQADHFYKDACPVALCEDEANGLAAAVPPSAQPAPDVREEHDPPASDSGRVPDVFAAAPTGRIPCFTGIDQFMQYFMAFSAQYERDRLTAGDKCPKNG